MATKRVYRFAVEWAYDNGSHQKGDLVSRHTTYELAEKACKNDCGFFRIVELPREDGSR